MAGRMVFGDGGDVPGSWEEGGGGGGATTLAMANGGERRQAGPRPRASDKPPKPEWLYRHYLGWPTLPGRRRWRTGGLRWRGWLSFGPPPLPPLKWPGSATAEHSYLERGAREVVSNLGSEAEAEAVAWTGDSAPEGKAELPNSRTRRWTINR